MRRVGKVEESSFRPRGGDKTAEIEISTGAILSPAEKGNGIFSLARVGKGLTNFNSQAMRQLAQGGAR